MSGGQYVGVNPAANIVSVKVLDEAGRGTSGDALAGIQWIIDNAAKYNIRVANLSIGTADTGSSDLLVQAVEAAWDMGIVMVVAAGNNGPNSSTITSPGTSKKVITVGAMDDENCEDAAGQPMRHFSGRGPTSECIVKPDILAAGCNVVAALTNSREISAQRLRGLKRVGEHYVKMSGTSMASPAVAGAISLLLARRPNMTPNEVKLFIKQTAKNLRLPPNRQGWGVLDITRWGL
ncbi:MAG: S8 family serine peptidase [Defluviitaleaceae bacterium]|nr:S8 family serine peptidase [Defluviitaleaceae bacterium]